MNGKVILIVEDDRDIRDLLADFLKREGFAVEVAEDGTAADRILARLVPDLVVLDLMLPGEDGLSICRRMRARGATPILMLTAKNDDIDRIVGLELGADDYLGKPFNPRELLAHIRDRGGAGLGLAIARHLVLSLGGIIAVEDRPGGGARFRVTLPARQ
jgi:two-component system OmpR family response regulator